ncbi:MAG: antibiotic biosynthesis monooxygenase [Proteobacteria bacterium]|nr:antibiotic biosynthesis monooxygenase [Pseudomonadota bacterium]
MSTIVSWNLRVSIRDGHFDEFKALMKEMVDSTRKESGTLAYEWFLSEDSKSCHIYERYSDSDAVMIHLGSFGSNFADRFLECVEPKSMMVYGEPTDAVRTALEGFGAEFLSTFGGFSH